MVCRRSIRRTERESVAELYWPQASGAKASSAYASALAYFAAGMALLGEDSWERRYRLTLELELNRAECEIVGGELAIAEDRLARLGPTCTTLSDQAQVVCLAVLLYFTTGRSERAVEVALGFLARVALSGRATGEEVRAEYLKMRRLLARQPIETLIDLPAMVDPLHRHHGGADRALSGGIAVDRYLLELVLLRMTNLSLEYGHAESSSVAYSALNMALGGISPTTRRRSALAGLPASWSIGVVPTLQGTCLLVFCRVHDAVVQARAAVPAADDAGVRDRQFEGRHGVRLLQLQEPDDPPADVGGPAGLVQREAEQAMAFARKLQLGLPAERFIEQLALVQKLRGVSVALGPPTTSGRCAMSRRTRNWR